MKSPDGQLIKDMSMIQVEIPAHQPSLFQRLLNRPQQIVNVMSEDIVVNRSLLERLVIIDDSITTYNAYKSKFL